MNARHILASLIIGAVAAYLYFVPPLQVELAVAKAEISALQTAAEKKTETPKQAANVNTSVSAGYGPKNTTTSTDTQTGQAITTKEETDIDMTVRAPDIYMRFNSDEYKLPGLPSEKYKFTDGKFTASIATDAIIDVTPLVEREVTLHISKNKKHGSAGLYTTNKGIAASAGYINKNFEYDVIATVPDTSKFYGFGVKVHF